MKNDELLSKQLLEAIPEFKECPSFKDSGIDLDI